MSWNYRLVEVEPKGYVGESYVTVHEVYYNQDGNIISWSTDPVNVYAENVKDFKWVLSKLNEATKKPLLKLVDGKLLEAKEVV